MYDSPPQIVDLKLVSVRLDAPADPLAESEPLFASTLRGTHRTCGFCFVARPLLVVVVYRDTGVPDSNRLFWHPSPFALPVVRLGTFRFSTFRQARTVLWFFPGASIAPTPA